MQRIAETYRQFRNDLLEHAAKDSRELRFDGCYQAAGARRPLSSALPVKYRPVGCHKQVIANNKSDQKKLHVQQ